MHDIAKFIHGFKRFQDSFFCTNQELFQRLSHGQAPKTLVIACSDSRVDPAILMDCSPGDVFVVRNVANLVPPYQPDAGYHGVSAALEFAVKSLQVINIIVLGHSQCGGIHSLMADGVTAAEAATGSDERFEFIDKWVSIAEPARLQVLEELSDKPLELKNKACEQAAILVSLDNLLTFPWIWTRVAQGRLTLHGWYFDLSRGELFSYLPQSGSFEPLVARCPNP